MLHALIQYTTDAACFSSFYLRAKSADVGNFMRRVRVLQDLKKGQGLTEYYVH